MDMLNFPNKLRKRDLLKEEMDFLIKRIKMKRRILDTLILKAPNLEKEKVQGGKKENAIEKLVLEICDMEMDLDIIKKEYELIDENLKNMQTIIEEYNEEEAKIFELKIKGFKRKSIAMEVGWSEATVQRKLDKLGLVNKRNKNKMIQK
jgi:hypothetical protein